LPAAATHSLNCRIPSQCPPHGEGWHAAARAAIPLVAEILSARQPSESDLRYLFLSLAAFSGHTLLALSLEALDAEVECPNCGTLFEPASRMG